MQAEAGGEDAVEGGRGAAALDVAEDGGPGLFAGAPLDLALQPVADPAQAGVAEGVGRRVGRRPGMPPIGCAPSATTMIGAKWLAKRRPTSSQTASMSNSRSGIRIALAPPARPAWTAIQPACRPITSTISTRWWLSAVVCRRSIASIAMLIAVSKPKV